MHSSSPILQTDISVAAILDCSEKKNSIFTTVSFSFLRSSFESLRFRSPIGEINCFSQTTNKFYRKAQTKFQLFCLTFTFKNGNTPGCLSLGVRWNRVTDDLRDFLFSNLCKP